MRLHIVGLPWTETTHRFSTCAYTQKIVKAGKMFLDEGHEVYIYSGEQNDAACTEHVTLFSLEEREKWFGAHDQNSLWGHITWDINSVPWRKVTGRAVKAIKARSEKRDLLLQVAGLVQLPMAEALPHLLACEPFVGYKGIYTDRCAFESHAWRHHVYGLNNIQVGRNYDTVIPNYFDPEDFGFRGRRGDHLLFVGRMNADKGPQIAAEVAKATGRELYLAGPGVSSAEPGRIVGNGVIIEGDVHYLGVLNPHDRAIAMSEAAALMAPTMYIEPFGGVAVEAMFCGTPAVTSDFGAFTETVVPGLSGCRFSTLADGVESVNNAVKLDHDVIRNYAEVEYSLDSVGPRFTHWFQNLDTLWEQGWYTLPQEVTA